jgi:hypothetical protein
MLDFSFDYSIHHDKLEMVVVDTTLLGSFYIFLRCFHLSKFGSCNEYFLVNVANFSSLKLFYNTRLLV